MTSNRSFQKTRLAPTPSGYLHLGNLFSFLLTRKLALESGAKILLRIDDLDRERVRPDYIKDIFETLSFMNLKCDEGPKNEAEFNAVFSQSTRKPLYDKALRTLAENKMVYACTCSRSEILNARKDGIYTGTCRDKNIPLDTPEVSWRLKTDTNKNVAMLTFQGSLVNTQLPTLMNDFVVRKRDGQAAYQLASLVDDLHFGMDLVVRGEDLWNSTVAQLYLAMMLDKKDFLKTTFHHHSLLNTSDGKKISKSAGDTSIQSLRKQGKTAEEMLRQLEKLSGQSLKI